MPRLPWALRALSLFTGLAGLSGLFGCAVITDLKLSPASGIGCASDASRVCGLDPEFETAFIVSGNGRYVCDGIVLTTGDSTTTNSGAHYFGSTGNIPWTGKHLYGPTAWPGIKTVRVTGAGSCFGDSRIGVRLMQRTPTAGGSGSFRFVERFTVGFDQPPLPAGNEAACAPVPRKMALRHGEIVTVDSSMGDQFRIDYGCALGGCVYDADGQPGTSAPGDFSFPGLKQYSLVFRVGSQVVQGGGMTRFTVDAGGPLEICLNDTVGRMSDNRGALLLSITVDDFLR